MQDAIGGYFSLELQHGNHYHADALRLNTARNCLEYIVCARKYTKVYIPYYTCDVILSSLQKVGVDYEFYRINETLEPIELPILQYNEAFLYTNYFGVKQSIVESLAKHYGSQLIVDNAQAFYAPHVGGIDTFYSPRKFFGIPDGGYLYTDCLLEEEFKQDVSYNRMKHLLQRIDEGAEAGYASFRSVAEQLKNQPILSMSRLTNDLLCSIDYDTSKQKRLQNYAVLNDALSTANRLKIEISSADVPMVYPYWTDDVKLRERLIKNRIFVAKYWPNVLECCTEDMLEYTLTNNIIPLPIDQRYDEEDMKRIVELIKQ